MMSLATFGVSDDDNNNNGSYLIETSPSNSSPSPNSTPFPSNFQHKIISNSFLTRRQFSAPAAYASAIPNSIASLSPSSSSASSSPALLSKADDRVLGRPSQIPGLRFSRSFSDPTADPSLPDPLSAPRLAECVVFPPNGSLQRKVQCDQCEKSFASVSGWKKHVESKHLGIRYPCKICNKGFIGPKEVEIHIDSVHYNKREYACHLCDKRYNEDKVLRKHILWVHYKVRDYRCRKCGKEFGQLVHLRRHFDSVHLGKVYTCHICCRKFTRDYRLKQHYVQDHGATTTVAHQYIVERRKAADASPAHSKLAFCEGEENAAKVDVSAEADGAGADGAGSDGSGAGASAAVGAVANVRRDAEEYPSLNDSLTSALDVETGERWTLDRDCNLKKKRERGEGRPKMRGISVARFSSGRALDHFYRDSLSDQLSYLSANPPSASSRTPYPLSPSPLPKNVRRPESSSINQIPVTENNWILTPPPPPLVKISTLKKLDSIASYSSIKSIPISLISSSPTLVDDVATSSPSPVIDATRSILSCAKGAFAEIGSSTSEKATDAVSSSPRIVEVEAAETILSLSRARLN